ncbi:MAG: hypothetical protein LBN95_05395 [Prevotellaceae bacterium]|jgi:hypothetical protein|nr:hypothetical protein [Prevotellaceae bacterium]
MAIVSYTWEELEKMPSYTDWERLRNMKDEDIDYSDIPPLTDEDFARATRGGKPLLSETEGNAILNAKKPKRAFPYPSILRKAAAL